MSDTTTTISKCPFCGGTKIRFRHHNVINGQRTYVEGQMVCKCGACGPSVKSPEFDRRNERISESGIRQMTEEALKLWNKCGTIEDIVEDLILH